MLDSGCTNCGDGRPTVCAVCDKYSDDAVKSLAEKHRTERTAKLITQAKLENMAIECGVAEGALKRCREERNTLRGDLETTSIELAETKESLMAARAASKLNSEEAFHWGAKYAAEEKAHDATMKTRDDHEEALNLIFSALGMDEHESEWSSANDPRAIAVEHAEALMGECERAVACCKVLRIALLKLIMNVQRGPEFKLMAPYKSIVTEAQAALTTTPSDMLEAVKRTAIEDYIDANGTTCDCCQHVMIDVTAAKDGARSHCTAGDPEGEGSGCAHGMQADFIVSGEVDGPDGL